MILAAIPKLPFIDKEHTLFFYTNQLGFTLRSDYGDYLIVERDGVELHFFSYKTLVPGNSDFMIYLRLKEGIDSFYEGIQNKLVKIHPNGKLENKPWRQREFAITDPNGTLLTFGQAL